MIPRTSRDPNGQAVVAVTGTCAQRSRWSVRRSWATRAAVISGTIAAAWLLGTATASALAVPDVDVGQRIEQVVSAGEDHDSASENITAQDPVSPAQQENPPSTSEAHHPLAAVLPVNVPLLGVVATSPSAPPAPDCERPSQDAGEIEDPDELVGDKLVEHVRPHLDPADEEPEASVPIPPETPAEAAPPAAPIAREFAEPPTPITGPTLDSSTGTSAETASETPLSRAAEVPEPTKAAPVHNTQPCRNSPLPMPAPPPPTLCSAASNASTGNGLRGMAVIVPWAPHIPAATNVGSDLPDVQVLTSTVAFGPSASPD